MPVGDLFEGEAEVFQGLGVSITPFKLTKVAETLCIPFLETVTISYNIRIVNSYSRYRLLFEEVWSF